MNQSPDVSDDIKIYAGMGIVCVQWALLEHLMLGLISCAEGTPLDLVYLKFGSLDMLPRVNMAMTLARYHKWPQPMISRIEAIRKQLQGINGRNGLQERRNQLVHGVHKESLNPQSVSLTMVRWGEPKRTKDVSILDIADLANQLGALAQEASSIFDAYGNWKFGLSREKNGSEQFAQAKAGSGCKIVQDFKGVIKRLFGNH